MKELGIGAFSPESKQKSIENRGDFSEKITGSNNGSFGTKFYFNIITKEKKRFRPDDVIPEGWVNSVEYADARKKTHWYNDGSKNYLLRNGDIKVELLGLVRGRL